MIEISGLSEDLTKVIINGVETDPVDGETYHDASTGDTYECVDGELLVTTGEAGGGSIEGGGDDPVNPPGPNPPFPGGGDDPKPDDPKPDDPVKPSGDEYGVNLNKIKFTNYRLAKAETKLGNAEIEYSKDDNGILSLGSFASKAEARAARIKLFLIGLKGYIFKK